ncbi:4671_t:CDS:2 [Funneliformis mosseae]|uniref:4671_t:CDS:1 n=1 Tax=Funneliformis mosseae TaxID=27381 RepID=A0A9N8WF99_FUNMO|nr:4671_t:CDS:2 [Funneliformis mosseae]
MPNMKPEVFNAVLNPQIILEILAASDEFILESLIDTIQTYMIEMQSEWLQLNIINPLNIVCKYEHITRLRNHLIELVCEKPHLLFASMDFPLLEESALIYVLKQDDLELEEMKILENVINWGAANSNPKLSQDRTKWTNNDLLVLKRTLHKCIPFIRFFHIHYNDLLSAPFQDILSKKLKNNVRNYHLNPYATERQIQVLPPRMSDKLDSDLISFNEINRVAGWIDYRGKPYAYQENPFVFKLLLRGSRDGFGIDTFHNLCDNEGATIVVIKVQGSGEVVGGYNPINWNVGKTSKRDNFGRIAYRDQRCYTSNSFIFSLTNPNDPTLSRVNSPMESIYWNGNKGPYFGSDLCMTNTSIWLSTQRSYERKIIQKEIFFAEDYEVFQVSIKNYQIRRKQMINNIDYKGIYSSSFVLCLFTFLYFSTSVTFKVFVFTLFGQLIVNWVLSYYQCYYQERLLDKVIYVDMALKIVPLLLIGRPS